MSGRIDPVLPYFLPEAVDILFASYHQENPTWGVLHAVLDDGNLSDADVQSCIAFAIEIGDAVGHALGILLASMTVEERDALSRRT